MRLNATEKNAQQAVEYLLWSSKIPVSSVGVEDDLLLHPDFPSMVSVSDSLTEWNVPNLATRLKVSQLKEIPLPALTYLNVRGGILAPIKRADDEIIEWLDTEKGWQRDSIVDFNQLWDGVTLLIEPDQQSGENDFSAKNSRQVMSGVRLSFLIGGAIICLLITLSFPGNYFHAIATHVYLLLGIKFAGVLAGGFLLWQSLDSDNPFLQNLCHLSSQNNCNSVLQSKAAKINSWLSWSEVGFVYFSGGFLAILFALLAGDLSAVGFLFLFSALSLPYTFFSIWYQAFVVKQWCTLCIAVQLLIWFEGIVAFTNYTQYAIELNVPTLMILTLAYLIPAIIWVMLKRPMQKASQVFDLQRELQKIKFSESYIRSAFVNQSEMPPVFTDMEIARYTESESPNILTVVTNPLCGPCSRLHDEIDKLLKNNTSNIRVQFIFAGSSRAHDIALSFLNTSVKQRKELMNSWYVNIQQDQQKWLAANQDKIHFQEGVNQLTYHTRWCEIAGITETPTIFLNGRKLPKVFKISDTPKIISALGQTANAFQV